MQEKTLTSNVAEGRVRVQNLCPELFIKGTTINKLLSASVHFIFFDKNQLSVEGSTLSNNHSEGEEETATKNKKLTRFTISYDSYETKGGNRVRLIVNYGNEKNESTLRTTYLGDMTSTDSPISTNTLMINFENGYKIIINNDTKTIGIAHDTPNKTTNFKEIPLMSYKNKEDIGKLLKEINKDSKVKILDIEINRETNIIAIKCKGIDLENNENILYLPLVLSINKKPLNIISTLITVDKPKAAKKNGLFLDPRDNLPFKLVTLNSVSIKIIKRYNTYIYKIGKFFLNINQINYLTKKARRILIQGGNYLEIRMIQSIIKDNLEYFGGLEQQESVEPLIDELEKIMPLTDSLVQELTIQTFRVLGLQKRD
ncbi:MAG: hypothetical protein WC744_00280 [Patescibacteria group bacterium]|jgi:hypothetical protein